MQSLLGSGFGTQDGAARINFKLLSDVAEGRSRLSTSALTENPCCRPRFVASASNLSAMSPFNEEKVLSVHHWTDRLFTFTTTRDASLRFSNGHFTMLGLHVNGKPLLRAYSIVSANYEDHLEFLSIKVPDGQKPSKKFEGFFWLIFKKN